MGNVFPRTDDEDDIEETYNSKPNTKKRITKNKKEKGNDYEYEYDYENDYEEEEELPPPQPKMKTRKRREIKNKTKGNRPSSLPKAKKERY